MKYNHMYDVAFTIETNNRESDVTADELIEGLEKRLVQLKSERLHRCLRVLRYL
jgi:hypothetical protein